MTKFGVLQKPICYATIQTIQKIIIAYHFWLKLLCVSRITRSRNANFLRTRVWNNLQSKFISISILRGHCILAKRDLSEQCWFAPQYEYDLPNFYEQFSN